MCELRRSTGLSIGRLAIVFSEPRSSVGRWVRDPGPAIRRLRRRPISDDPVLREQIRQLCLEPRIAWLLNNPCASSSSPRCLREPQDRVMRELGLTQPRIRRRPLRPKRVEHMRPHRPNQA